MISIAMTHVSKHQALHWTVHVGAGWHPGSTGGWAKKQGGTAVASDVVGKVGENLVNSMVYILYI